MNARSKRAAAVAALLALVAGASARPARPHQEAPGATDARLELWRRAAREDALIRSDRTAILVGELLDARALARWREVGP